jgi:hypothetical protein
VAHALRDEAAPITRRLRSDDGGEPFMAILRPEIGRPELIENKARWDAFRE